MVRSISEPSVKNSWISFVVLEATLLLTLGLASPALGAKKKERDPEELTNFLLSPRYSQWLVGPVARMATAEETKKYLSLQVDEEAVAFVEGFWQTRGGSSVFAAQGPRAIFDARMKEADRIFSDGTFRGHRTDRGTIFVLYGEPDEMRFEEAPRGRGDFLEIWEYPKDTDKGLDDKKPERFYRFVKKGDRTVFYRGPLNRLQSGASIRQ